MKTLNVRGTKNPTIERLVLSYAENTLPHEGLGALESVQSHVDGTAGIVARLMQTLADKGVLTDDELVHIIGCKYDIVQ